MQDTQLETVRELLKPVSFEIFGTVMHFRVERDVVNPMDGRIFIQVFYSAPCTKTGAVEQWFGGKHYLSEHMTEDEIVKRAWVACEAAVKHECMEGFKYQNIILFNPHVHFRDLLAVSHKEIKRPSITAQEDKIIE